MNASINPNFAVRSVTTSMDFYLNTLGLFTHEGEPLRDPSGQPVFAGVMYQGTMLMLDGSPESQPPADAPRGLGVQVHIILDPTFDIDALYSRLQANNVTIVEPIRDEFWGERRFVAADPDGYLLSFAKTVREVSAEEMQAVTGGTASANGSSF